MQEILNEEIKSLELHVDNFSSHRWYCIMFNDCRVTIPSLYNNRDKFFWNKHQVKWKDGKVQSSFNDNVESVMHACIHIYDMCIMVINNPPHRQHTYLLS